jgi:hypothetical protein
MLFKFNPSLLQFMISRPNLILILGMFHGWMLHNHIHKEGLISMGDVGDLLIYVFAFGKLGQNLVKEVPRSFEMLVGLKLLSLIWRWKKRNIQQVVYNKE